MPEQRPPNPLLHDVRGFNADLAARTANTLGQMPGGPGMREMGALVQGGTRMANARGLDSQLGLQTAVSSAAFGDAFGRMTKGQGLMGRGETTRLDQELRLAAAESPLANVMGASLAMAQAGVLQGQLGKDLLGSNEQRDKALTEIGKMGPAGFMEQARKMGVDPNVAASFMNAKGANQEQVAKFGVADKVREFQKVELQGTIAEKLSDSMQGMLRHAGINDPQARRAIGAQAGTQLADALQTMDKELLNNPNKMKERNEALSKAMGNLPANVDKQALITSSMRNLEESFKSDPQLGRLGGLKQALAMNRGEIMNAGAAELAGAAGKAGEDVGKLTAADAKAPAQGAADANKGGAGQKIEMHFAKLTINGDGSGDLQAPADGV